ncbi:hydrogenase expression/formation protein HypE [Blastopirellula sp. JC732]|uniref:Hydrogenase expression/formation protein HypE n=1 Tax=Blastopirellula sediminis TaxID=2894196 RepID=A0A9X1SF88_9BACT|nr:hydrogenase expression/formation protein HypE [Blastopirellula sediminis]MCC9608338.1 hydrogenase expression/formation protein HypE [Blastopirellula sediminis]MCC9628885.1 hydrogenase expression/formation protein HypE [Blastopirellula sediminis]
MSAFPNDCPIPLASDEFVTLAHGEGGRAARRLIEERIIPRLGSPLALQMGDSVELPPLSGPPMMTTDSYVVSPLFFPGGDIGKLAIFGTINDLAVAGARPRWISLAMIIEEGFALIALEQILQSISAAANLADVQVVTGDTKVVPRGAADGIFLTTTGLGEQIDPAPLGPQRLKVGDVIIASGPIGKHGVAILAARENLRFDPMPKSDCGSLWPAVEALRLSGSQICAMRDATRGGAAAVLQEWGAASQLTMEIEEAAIPVSPEVRGVCELLGLDPLHLPNEGTMLVAVPEVGVDQALAALRGSGRSPDAAVIGRVAARRSAAVVIRRGRGMEIPLDDPQGAPLPRIC